MRSPNKLVLSRRAVDALPVAEREAVFWDRDLSGFGVRVHPTGSKVYMVHTRAQGKSRRVTIGRHGVWTPERARREAGRLIASLKAGESALRVSDCVTELLRKQPFFGSLVLRLPLRPDPTRETLATDGHEIRYSPRWVADTDSHLIETAMARVVMACALKHHTRRGERDPERWQMASQLVTHALLRDAGFTLPPDAEAWEEVSVEQAYDRLPEPGADDSGDDADASSGAAGADDSADGQPSPDGDDEDGDSQPNGEDGDGQGQDGNDEGDEGTSDAPPSHDPSGTGEVMDADARARDGGDCAEAPVDITAEEQAWDEAMHQALNIARAEGKVPGQVEETIQGAHASTLDWRTLLRRYMTDTAKRDYPRGRSGAALGLCSRHVEGELQLLHPRLACRSVPGGRTSPRSLRALRGPGRHDCAGRGRVRRRRPSRGDRRQGPGRHRLPPGLRMARRAGDPARGVPNAARPRCSMRTSPIPSSESSPCPTRSAPRTSGSLLA